MTFKADQIGRLWWTGVTDPRQSAEAVLQAGVPRQALFLLAGIVAIIVTVLMAVQGALTEPPPVLVGDEPVEPIRVLPLPLALMVYLFIIGYSWALAALGRGLGGTGTFEASLLLATYLQALMIGFQIVEIAALLLVPPLAGVVAIATFFVGLWLNLQFVDVLHGFGSLLKSFMLMIAVGAAFAIGFMVLLTLTGAQIAG